MITKLILQLQLMLKEVAHEHLLCFSIASSNGLTTVTEISYTAGYHISFVAKKCLYYVFLAKIKIAFDKC